MYKIIDLFAGVGGIRLGFEDHDCECVFSSEFDKSCQKVYKDNFGEEPFGDINDIKPSEVPDHDILLAGFPCQPFSIAGKGLGFEDTRGTLFFNIEEIIKEKRPSAFLLENVKRLKNHDNGRTLSIIKEKLQNLGYKLYIDVLNTLDYGLPQKRERIFIIGFKENIHFNFPKKMPRDTVSLSDVLQDDGEIDAKYFLSDEIRKKRKKSLKKEAPFPSVWHENIGGNVSALPYSCALRAGGSYNYLVVNGVRRLTGREMMRLQGFPDSFKMDIPYTQTRKIAGNSVSVPVIKALANQIIYSLDNKPIANDYTQLEMEIT